MVEDAVQLVRLKNDFYRDGFFKALMAMAAVVVAILLLITVSIYLIMTKPSPVAFATDNDWRVLPPVPLEVPYLSIPEMLQWVSYVIPISFTFDFTNYQTQLKNNNNYFTENGWKIYQGQLDNYVNANTVQTAKQFVSASLAGAPVVLRQGILPEGAYGWWVQVPFNVTYSTVAGATTQPLLAQVLVVRVPTLNNLSGVAIDNMTISQGSGDQIV